jgi:hypothetical protein
MELTMNVRFNNLYNNINFGVVMSSFLIEQSSGAFNFAEEVAREAEDAIKRGWLEILKNHSPFAEKRYDY